MSHVDPLADPSKKPAPRVCGVCRDEFDLWAWDDGCSAPSGAPEAVSSGGEWVWDEVEWSHPPYMNYVCSWQCSSRAHW